MTRVVWVKSAQADLARIDDFNARRGRDFADRVGRAAIAAGRFLAGNPEAGPALHAGERKWRVPSTDYVLVYRIVASRIEILRVYHGRENWRRLDP